MLGHRGCVLAFLLGSNRDAGTGDYRSHAFKKKASGKSRNWYHWLDLKELEIQVDVIHQTAKKVFAARGKGTWSEQ